MDGQCDFEGTAHVADFPVGARRTGDAVVAGHAARLHDVGLGIAHDQGAVECFGAHVGAVGVLLQFGQRGLLKFVELALGHAPGERVVAVERDRVARFVLREVVPQVDHEGGGQGQAAGHVFVIVGDFGATLARPRQDFCGVEVAKVRDRHRLAFGGVLRDVEQCLLHRRINQPDQRQRNAHQDAGQQGQGPPVHEQGFAFCCGWGGIHGDSEMSGAGVDANPRLNRQKTQQIQISMT